MKIGGRKIGFERMGFGFNRAVWRRGRSLPCALLFWCAWSGTPGVASEPGWKEQPNRVGFSAKFGFNVSATFQTLNPSLPAIPGSPTDPGPATGGGVDRIYRDGFVRRDASGNQGGTTWFWGYTDAAQIDRNADQIAFGATTTSTKGATAEAEDAPYFGFELDYSRRVTELGPGVLGVEVAFSAVNVANEASSQLARSTTHITDRYPLGGILPPSAPYTGTAAGPGPVIGDAPTRTSSQEIAQITARQELETQLYGFRLGPVYELPLGTRLTVSFSAGLAAVLGESDYTVSSRSASPGGGVVGASTAVADTDWLLGGYARASLSLGISRRLGLFAGIEGQFLEDLELGSTAGTVTLDLGTPVYAFAGVHVGF
jgi:hypothetical protein